VASLVLGGRPQRRRAARAGRGQQRQRIEIDRLLGVAREPDEEHLVAALGALDDHRGADRHHQPVEHLAAVLLPADIPAEGLRAGQPQLVPVAPHQRLLRAASLLHRQRATDEVADVEHRRAPGHRLPVDDGAALTGEQQVVQPEVAVHEPERRAAVERHRVERGHEGAAQLGVLRRNVLAVALEELRQQRRHQRAAPRGRA
jgi:hypothetical protein